MLSRPVPLAVTNISGRDRWIEKIQNAPDWGRCKDLPFSEPRYLIQADSSPKLVRSNKIIILHISNNIIILYILQYFIYNANADVRAKD